MSDSASPWTAARQAPLTFTVSQRLHKLMSTESVMLSNHLILCCPVLLLPSSCTSIRVLSNELALCIRRPKYWSFSFSITPFNEYSGLISFRIDWFDFSRVFSSTTVQKHQFSGTQPFFIVQLSFDSWKNYSFDYMAYTDLCCCYQLLVLLSSAFASMPSDHSASTKYFDSSVGLALW